MLYFIWSAKSGLALPQRHPPEEEGMPLDTARGIAFGYNRDVARGQEQPEDVYFVLPIFLRPMFEGVSKEAMLAREEKIAKLGKLIAEFDRVRSGT